MISRNPVGRVEPAVTAVNSRPVVEMAGSTRPTGLHA